MFHDWKWYDYVAWAITAAVVAYSVWRLWPAVTYFFLIIPGVKR